MPGDEDKTREQLLEELAAARQSTREIGALEAENRRLAEALRKSEERRRGISEESVVAIYMFDAEKNFLEANQAGVDLLGYPKAELLRINISDVDADPVVVRPAHAQLLSGDRLINYEHRLRRKDGGIVTVLNNSRVLRDAAGSVTGLQSTLVDITKLRQTEEEHLSLQRQIQHTQKLESLGVLAGGIAHDFNNLLTSILGNADLALDLLSASAPARHSIEEVVKASNRAAELARQMLAYSGRGRFVIEPIDLNAFVEEMGNFLEASISKKAELKYNFADNLPAFDGDATQIRQIIMNLITNASEAIGERSGIIAISTGAMNCDRAYLDSIGELVPTNRDEEPAEGLYTYFEVADTGCGMDSETIGKLFDPFFTTKFTGRGLGMSAVLGIVRGHNGAVKVYSEVDKGTTFKILLPANELAEHGVGFVKDEDQSDAMTWQGTGTILLVDDEEAVRSVGEQMVERLGFVALLAADGRAAVELLREHADEIVCVLLDLTMPHMDGEEAFREMRRICPDVRVVICSGYNMQDATQRFVGKGLAGFIQKPYVMADLRKTFARLFGS